MLSGRPLRVLLGVKKAWLREQAFTVSEGRGWLLPRAPGEGMFQASLWRVGGRPLPWLNAVFPQCKSVSGSKFPSKNTSPTGLGSPLKTAP